MESISNEATIIGNGTLSGQQDRPSSAGIWTRRSLLLTAGMLALTGTGTLPGTAATVPPTHVSDSKFKLPSRASIVKEFAHRFPQHFGMFLSHTVTTGIPACH